MEQRNYLRRKSRIPAFIRSGCTRHLTEDACDTSKSLHGQDAKDFNRESGASKKTVTMAPTSRYMTGRSLYMARKPLISTEHHSSILKNPLAHEYSERVQLSNLENSQDERTDTNILESTSDPQITVSSLSATREDLCASLNLSELRLYSSHGEPNINPIHSTNIVENRSLCSSPLDDLSLTAPLSPKWTSTQRILPYSYKSQTHTSKSTNTRAYQQERHSFLDTGFSVSNSKRYPSESKRMSHCQANYWACAIPSTLPPSSDRKSPSWDPDKEYQTLLDYTYPLRPNMTNAWNSNKHRLQTDQPLHDSGIEVDSFLSSSSLSFLDQPLSGMRQDRSGPAYNQTFGFQCPNLRELPHSKSSDLRVSTSLNSSLEQVGLSLESLDCGKDNFRYKKFGIFSTSRSAPTFIRTTSILPHLGSLGEWDEEFLQLPEQLQEIQDLSQKLKDITVQISQPVTTNWEPLQREHASSSLQVDEQAPEVSSVQGSTEDVSLTAQMKGLDTRAQVISHQMTNVEAIVDQLSGMSSYEFKREKETDKGVEDTQESLMQHLQIFCSNLQKLIQWLHKVVEKIDVLSPPSVDIESVKTSLADYKSFQEEVQAHRPLTTSVLQTGEMLLCCMNSASPFLKDTLMLIERQSHVLEAHSEHLFSSILSTMDCLTEPNSQDNTEEASFSSQDQ
ncbi:hypothetical protein KOW79_002354 [Hemibagrus wyckioides]|uniref:Centrosomal protein of 68 kDa n=1 Tax=Hemibagrus wyckioides TaxID=337641 RepID=A0A9D3P7M4_9TELE|nr:centrosomal protein of 68 kDa [Hemibagrus wyckioides]KAG7333947.1 hypothetical protein KOW79_002354 [Hemibagrus wyckioides]